MINRKTLKAFLDEFGTRYPRVLGINLEDGQEDEIFKWFLASLLFGAPITENTAMKTYACFQKHDVLTPQKILESGWDGLVKILDEGGYTRYDFKTADKLLEVMRNITEQYDGSLSLLYSRASGPDDLENRLKSLGKGIGSVTVSIFLREFRGVWQKAKSNPTSLVILAAKNLAIVEDESATEALEQLGHFWARNQVMEESFVNFETALLRLGKDFCRKKRCACCPVKSDCMSPHVTDG